MPFGMTITLRRGAAADPVSNGYTRTARGFVGSFGFLPPIQTGPGPNNLQRVPVSNFAGVLQAIGNRARLRAQDDPSHTLYGIELGSARIFVGERGANGGPEVWTNADGFLGGLQKPADNAENFKLAITADDGRLRAWNTDGIVWDQLTPGAFRGNGFLWQSSDNNPDNNGGVGNYSAIVACLDNALHFANCPALGSVTVTIGHEAPIVVNLDAAGAGALDVDARRFPLAVSYVIQTAAAVVVASLFIPASYGGDVVGLR